MGVTRGRRRKWVSCGFGFGGIVGAGGLLDRGMYMVRNRVIRKGFRKLRCDDSIVDCLWQE